MKPASTKFKTTIYLNEKQAADLGGRADDAVRVDCVIVTEDQGIGAYECHGCKGYDSQIVTYVESVALAGTNKAIEITDEQEGEILKDFDKECYDYRCSNWPNGNE